MEKDKVLKVSRATSGLLFVLLAISAFYIHGTKGAILILLILWPLTSLLALVGVIPVVGQVVYWLVATQILFPTFFSWFPDVEVSWVTETIFWLGMIYNVGFTIGIFVFRSMIDELLS